MSQSYLQKRFSFINMMLSLFFLMSCDKSEIVDWSTVEMADANDTAIPLILKGAYERDAGSLSLRYLHSENNGKYEGIEIPAQIVNTHYYSLIHVYNAVNIAARDSIVTIYDIHTNNYPDTRELLLSINPNAVWVNSWRNDQQITGVADIDSLMEKYDLQMISITYNPPLQLELVVLESGRPLNIKALAKCFKGIDGIIGAEARASGISLLGNNIYSYYQMDHLLLDYKYEWFDMQYRYWTFKVYLNGRVEFVGSRGSPLP